MSYPYGPESYPTFEKLENAYNLEDLRHAFYYELHRRARAAKVEHDRRRLFVSLSGNLESHGSIERGNYPEEPSAEDYGAAFAAALEYTLDEEDIEFFFRDLFAILEDKIVSAGDKEESDWAEDAEWAYQAAAVRKIVAENPERAGDYAGDAENYDRKREAFLKMKHTEVDGRARANAEKAAAAN